MSRVPHLPIGCRDCGRTLDDCTCTRDTLLLAFGVLVLGVVVTCAAVWWLI